MQGCRSHSIAIVYGTLWHLSNSRYLLLRKAKTFDERVTIGWSNNLVPKKWEGITLIADDQVPRYHKIVRDL